MTSISENEPHRRASKLRFVAIAPFYLPYPGGAEKSMHEMLSRLVALGWEGDALIPLAPFPMAPPERPGISVMDGVVVRRMPEESWFTAVGAATREADVVLFSLAHLFRAQFDTRLDKLLHGCRQKVVYFCRGADPHDYFPGAIVVANSSTVLKGLPAHSFVRKLILTPLIAKPREVAGARRRFVTLINPSAEKGGHMLVELARRMPQVAFLAQLGRGEPVVSIYDQPNITVCPPVQDLDGVYAETSVLLVPSFNEPFGRVALEGALAGCLLLLHRAAGLREIPVPDFCYVSDLSPSAWEIRLSELLEAGEGTREAWVTEIRCRALTYDPGWEAFVAHLTELGERNGSHGVEEHLTASGDLPATNAEHVFEVLLPAQLKREKRLAEAFRCSCKVVLSGRTSKSWIVHFDGPASRVVRSEATADCEVFVDETDFLEVACGRTTAEFLMSTPGRIKVIGDLRAAGAFVRLLYSSRAY